MCSFSLGKIIATKSLLIMFLKFNWPVVCHRIAIRPARRRCCQCHHHHEQRSKILPARADTNQISTHLIPSPTTINKMSVLSLISYFIKAISLIY
jgi:hypothetical protein